jgi:hypothetical protein
VKVTIAELKRRLPPGTRFRARYTHGQLPGTCREWQGREVKSNTSTLQSLVLDGPKAGEVAHLDWVGVKAFDGEGLTVLYDKQGREFMRLDLGEAAVSP